MHFEDLLAKIGEFGLYQKLLCFIVIPFTTGVCGFTFYTQIFILTAPFHTCHRQETEGEIGRNATASSNITEIVFMNKLSRLLFETDYRSPARSPYACHQFDTNLTSSWLNETNWIVNVTSLDQITPPTNTCINGWEYDQDLMFPTYTSEHDFVCEDAWRPYLVATAFWIGNTVGSWIFGFISDTYGRRPTVALSHVIYGVAGIASVFVSDFYGFLFLRIMVGFAHHTISHLPFVLVVEYCGLNSRTIPLLTIMMTYTIASILTPLLAWLIWDWRTLALVTSVPPLLILIFYKWLPESSSWLIAKGRSQEAKKQLDIVAKVNGMELPNQMLIQLLSETRTSSSRSSDSPASLESKENRTENEESEEKVLNLQVDDGKKAHHSIIHVVRYPNLRRNVFMVLLVWMLSCMCYYGHCQNTAHLSSNIFLSYLLGAVVEIPSWSAPWLINKFGRRKPLVVAFLIAGAASLLYSALPQDVTWLVLTMALIGRASITGAYYITLQYGPEIFPTVVRGQGVALSETLGGVAIFLSPSIVYLGEFHKTAPLLVFGGLSVLAGFATFLLPETCGVALPQTLSQAEHFSQNSGTLIPCCLKPKETPSEPSESEA